MTDIGDSMRLEKAARRRLNDFERKCGKEALHLAYHAALPVALNADLLHLLRINFFLDPPESLLYTAEADLLFSPFCHEIGEDLYEIDAETRDLLLQGLAEEYDQERIRDVATLLWQYNENYSPWASRTGLQRTQQLTALSFLDPSKARQWLAEAETWVGQGPSAEREWFVAMSEEIERGRERDSFTDEERQGERAVPIPAILIAGPPNAGKSVLAYSLTQALRDRGVLHHLLRASPDGEGDWSQDADQETIRLFRVKGSWTETFIEGMCRDIERRQYPFIVDLGGRLGEAQIPILRRCTHALLLLRANEEETTQPWRDLVEREGLLPLARIYSALDGTATITSLEPIIQGTLVGLERSKPAQGPLFDALVDRIASLFASHSLEELRKRQLDAAPVELVIDLDALLQTRFPQSERWEPEMLVDLLAELSNDTPLAVYGVGPNWLYGAVAAHVYQQRFYLFDPRIGWVSSPPLQISLHTTEVIHVQVREDEHFTILWVDIPKQYLDYSQSERLPFPPIPPGRGLIIYGKTPHWLLTAIVRLYYKAEVGWVACYLPQLRGAIIVASRMSDHALGELLPLSLSIPRPDMDEVPEALPEVSDEDARQITGKVSLIGLPSELYNRCRTILLTCDEFKSDENLSAVFVTSGLEAYHNRIPEASSIPDRIDRCLAFLLNRQWEGEYSLLLFIEALRDRYHQDDDMHATLDELGRDIRSALKDTPTAGQDISISDLRREALPTMESQRAIEDESYREEVPVALAPHPSEPLQQEALAATRATGLRDRYAQTGDLADLEAAITAYQQTLQATPADSPDRPAFLNNLGNGLRARYGRTGKLADLEAAITAYQQSVQTTPPDSPDQPTYLSNLGKGLRDRYARTGNLADLEAAIDASQQAVQATSPDSPNRPVMLNNLAALYEKQGKYEEAEPLLVRALAIVEQQLGTEHPDTATSLNNLARLYQNQGKYAQAEPLYVRALAIDEQELGTTHPDTARGLNNLAALYQDQGKYTQAEPLFQQAIAIQRTALGETHPYVATSLNKLAELYYKIGDYAQAEPLFQQVLVIRRAVLGEAHPDVADSLSNLGQLYHAMGNYEQAELLYLHALRIWEDQLGPEHPQAQALRRSYVSLLGIMRRDEKFSHEPNNDARPEESISSDKMLDKTFKTVQTTSKQIFRFNMPLNDPAEYYGRDHARTTLLSRTGNGGSSSIVGERRMGKTWLMEYLQLVAPTNSNLGPRFRIGYLSATHPQCKTLVGFTMKALEVLKVPVSHLDQAHIQFNQLAKAIIDLKAQGIVPVLCIDEFEGFDNKQEFNQDFVEGLRAMTQDDGLVLITASRRPIAEIIMGMMGQTSPLFNIIKQVTLKPFIETEAERFVQEKSIQAAFNDQERAFFLKCATIYQQNGEKQWPPLRLQLVGQMLLDDKRAAQHEPQRYRLDDVRYQVDFEKRLAEEYQVVVKHA